ncbi:MAG: hypothetical protein RLZZ361_658 [Cyanobacteriota bacterium]|jgi:hypothetical protein
MTPIVALVLAAAPFFANNSTARAFAGNSAITSAESCVPSDNRNNGVKLCRAQ